MHSLLHITIKIWVEFPQVQEFRYRLGRLLVREGNFESAAEEFRRLLKDLPSDTEALDLATLIKASLWGCQDDKATVESLMKIMVSRQVELPQDLGVTIEASQALEVTDGQNLALAQQFEVAALGRRGREVPTVQASPISVDQKRGGTAGGIDVDPVVRTIRVVDLDPGDRWVRVLVPVGVGKSFEKL